VLAALAHRQPDRVPFSWGFGPTPEMSRALARFLAERRLDWARLRAATDDKRAVGPTYHGPDLPEGTDIWGIRRTPAAYCGGSYDEIAHYPLAGARAIPDLDRHRWPDPDWFDYAGLPALLREADPGRQRALQVRGANPFEVYCWMTGLEEAMVNLVINPDLVRAGLERIVAFELVRLRRVSEAIGAEIDLVLMADDLGGQTGLLMSRETYRAVIQPYHRLFVASCREHVPRARVIFHTDGAVFDVLPDLIDAGIDVLEAVQTDAAGMLPENLKSAYGARLAFHGGISVQQLLPRADAATVEGECRRLVHVFGENGGYIAAPAHALQGGTPPENVLAMLRGVLGEGDLAAALAQAATAR
jgi:uroporphyrinogen decarboxylase